MTLSPNDRLAQRLAFGIPALLLAGAYVAEYGFGLYPCEMCWWQRFPHFIALGLAAASTVTAPRRAWIVLAGLNVLVSGVVGGFHAGVEYGWWEGITGCSMAIDAGGGNALDNILNAPMVRCDVAPWSFLGVSLAGWNFIISTASGLFIMALVAKGRTAK